MLNHEHERLLCLLNVRLGTWWMGNLGLGRCNDNVFWV